MIYDTASYYIKTIEKQRQAEERERNLQRLIVYNNKRIAAGLPPFEYPPALWKPLHRDIVLMTLR